MPSRPTLATVPQGSLFCSRNSVEGIGARVSSPATRPVVGRGGPVPPTIFAPSMERSGPDGSPVGTPRRWPGPAEAGALGGGWEVVLPKRQRAGALQNLAEFRTASMVAKRFGVRQPSAAFPPITLRLRASLRPPLVSASGAHVLRRHDVGLPPSASCAMIDSRIMKKEPKTEDSPLCGVFRP
jgi:hypothetical protein